MATNEFRQIRLEAGDVDRSDRWYINAVREFAKGVDNPMSVFSSAGGCMMST